MPLLRSLTWIYMYQRKELIDHRPMIMNVYGYTLARNSSMSKTGLEWVIAQLFVREPETFLSKGKCAWPQWFDCHLGCYICFVVLYPHCVNWSVAWWSWVQFQSCDDVRPYLHWAYMFSRPPLVHCGVFTPFFFVLNVDDTLYVRCMQPMLLSSSSCFL